MFSHARIFVRRCRRRGVVAVQVAVLMVVLVGFAALTVDLGMLYNDKADLQRSCDAAALAAASKLSDWSAGDPTAAARQAAADYVARNRVMNQVLSLDDDRDVIMGRVNFNTTTRQYTFTPTNTAPDAVSVTLRQTTDSPNGAVPLLFARIFGRQSSQLQASATAIMTPRDIAIVADLSASHTDDSELRNYRSTEINLYDVWSDLPGGDDEVSAGCEGVACAAGQICVSGGCMNPVGAMGTNEGPAWGYFSRLGFGTQTITTAYDPVSDPGLVRLPYNVTWTDASLRTAILNRGYSVTEANALMNKQYDASGGYPYRTAVALGFAFWNSGIAGGLWQSRGAPAGNANTWVSSTEVEWSETVMGQPLSASDDIWLDYINTYMKGTTSEMYQANSNFRYRFGIKTFVNYLLEKRPSNTSTPELADVPTQPMQAVKDAVGYMAQIVDELDTDDMLSLEIYGTTGRHEVNLTRDYRQVGDRLHEMQAGHYDSWTNVGGGMQRAIEELTGTRSRSTSKKMIVLLTDGNANVNASGGTNDESGGNAYALDRARAAADQGIYIFAVSVGADSNPSLMQQIADIGHGEHFHAEGSIEEYSEQLAEIFRRLAGVRPVELIR